MQAALKTSSCSLSEISEKQFRLYQPATEVNGVERNGDASKDSQTTFRFFTVTCIKSWKVTFLSCI